MEEYMRKGYEELCRQREKDQLFIRDKINLLATDKGRIVNTFGNRLDVEMRKRENDSLCKINKTKQPEQNRMEIEPRKENTTTATEVITTDLGEENGIQARDDNEGIVNDVTTYEQPVGSQSKERISEDNSEEDDSDGFSNLIDQIMEQ